MSREQSSPDEDVVLVHGVTQDGKGLEVLRCRENRIEAGAVRPLEEGKPVLGEVVQLSPRPNQPLVCDVKVQVPAPPRAGHRKAGAAQAPPAVAVNNAAAASDAIQAGRGGRKGPAQVASTAYRKNWGTIWKRGRNRALPN